MSSSELPETLKSLIFEKQLATKGYVIIEDGLNSEDIFKLKEFFELNMQTGEGEAKAGVSSLHENEIRKNMSALIKAAFTPFVDKHFIDHKAVAGHFIVKFPNCENAINPHHEMTILDELQHRSINVWSPLIDVGNMEGPLQVLGGSHRLSNKFRGSVIPSPYASIFSDFAICKNSKTPDLWDKKLSKRLDEQFKTIYVKKGSVLIFDSNLIHRSLKLRGSICRVAVGGYVAPRSAQLVHHHFNIDEAIEEYEINEEFFLEYTNGDAPNKQYKIRRTIPFNQKINHSDLSLLRRISKNESAPNTTNRLFTFIKSRFS